MSTFQLRFKVGKKKQKRKDTLAYFVSLLIIKKILSTNFFIYIFN